MIATAYAVLFVLAAAVGLPLGFALFGRRQPGGWIAGALIGYAFSALAVWVPIRLGIASPFAFMIAWAVASVAARIIAARLPQPLAALPPWTTRAAAALGLVLMVTLALAVPPFLIAGAHNTQNNHNKHTKNTTKNVWQEALMAEVAKFASPPRNPYLAHRPIHYYWTYYLPLEAGA